MKPRSRHRSPPPPKTPVTPLHHLPDGITNVHLSKDGLTPFSIPDPQKSMRNVFYAMLKTNENTKDVRQKFRNLRLQGTYVGVGFGASFQCLRYFFDQKFTHAILCDREPNVYFMGKILIYLARNSETGEEFFLRLFDHDSFEHAYMKLIQEESEVSPLFYRSPKDTWVKQVPPEIHYLRRYIFSTNKDPISLEEEQLFLKRDLPLNHAMDWIMMVLEERVQYSVNWFCREFNAIKQVLENPITPLCIDFFSPKLWSYLGTVEPLWQHSSLVYFSNAAIYAKGMTIQPEQYSISNGYTPSLMEQLPEANKGKHNFLFAETKEGDKRYHLRWMRKIPSTKDMIGSFDFRRDS